MKASRRQFLSGLGLASISSSGFLTSMGCSPESGAGVDDDIASTRGSTTGNERSDVPLRVVFSGNEIDTETLQRSWASISDQPLTIQSVSSDFIAITNDRDTEDRLWDAIAASDVVLVPLYRLPELIDRDQSMPIPSSVAETPDVIPPLVQLVLRYAGEPHGRLLGGHLLALCLTEQVTARRVSTWEQCEQLAKRHQGRFALPLGPSHAAETFLSVAASSVFIDWLFTPKTMQPTISQPAYVEALSRFIRLSEFADPASSVSPTTVWQAAEEGQIDFGIGYPKGISGATDRSELANTAIRVMDLPTPSDQRDSDFLSRSRQMVDPTSLVAIMPASCRQTAAATQFVNWIAGGEGSESLYRSLDQLIDRNMRPQEQDTTRSGYRQWWMAQQSRTNLAPSPNLIRAAEYLSILDKAIRSAVDGETSPGEALADVADRWQDLHREVGVSRQSRVWQRLTS